LPTFLDRTWIAIKGGSAKPVQGVGIFKEKHLNDEMFFSKISIILMRVKMK
jgi:hypothetical protein